MSALDLDDKPADGEPAVSRRGILGWMFFDWAAQPFHTLVVTFVFAPYFAAQVAPNPTEGQALWGYATGAAGVVIALDHDGADRDLRDILSLIAARLAMPVRVCLLRAAASPANRSSAGRSSTTKRQGSSLP